jgi:hypothetical protein
LKGYDSGVIASRAIWLERPQYSVVQHLVELFLAMGLDAIRHGIRKEIIGPHSMPNRTVGRASSSSFLLVGAGTTSTHIPPLLV